MEKMDKIILYENGIYKVADVYYNNNLDNDILIGNILKADLEYQQKKLNDQKLKPYQFIKKSKKKKELKKVDKDINFTNDYLQMLENEKDEKIAFYEVGIYKQAKDNNDIDKNGKIPAIENALNNKIEKDVATMMATSHEYKKPNVDAALALVKNYKWEKSKIKISDLQGIEKPVNKEKVLNMAMDIKSNKNKVEPFIVVNQLHGIRPQSSGKKILLDGHHRKEACKFLGMQEVPVYKGTFTGGAQLSKDELREKVAMYEDGIYKEARIIDKVETFNY